MLVLLELFLGFFEGLTCDDLLASLAIAERSLGCKLASAEMKTFTLLIETELQWLEESAIMRGVAEWLALGETALAVVVVLCSEDWLLDKVRADFR